MNFRLRMLPGALLLLLGTGAVARSALVLSTFLLDLVAGTISSKPVTELEPFDYSWGTMKWGTMGADFPWLAAGLALMVVGQFWIVPSTVGRIRLARTENAARLAKLAMIAASVLTAVAAASFLLIPVLTKSAFGVLATTGVVDPVQFGEDLPVRSNMVFVCTLMGAQFLVLVAAFAAPGERAEATHRTGTVLAVAGCASFAAFTVGIVSTYLGPIRSISEVLGSGSAADPVALAMKISQGLNLMIMASPFLAVAAVLWLLAVFVPGRREL